ncbi:MAG: mandelate racemase/muconate lactonizing enzyme family protein [Chloroflexi bacterium]|nr:mandelate racemase/muconate lactonizing enzyme family protein [Chloroflexota bacterium]
MKITDIEVIALRDPGDGSVASWNVGAADAGVAAGYDFTLVRVHTDGGVTGIGQCEAPSLVIHAIVNNSMGLKPLIVGEDPREVQRLWQKMYNATGLYGRRGVVIGAIGAVETALWDIAGKAAGLPVHRLAWRSFTTTATPAEPLSSVTPYVTVYPPGDDIAQLRERVQMAVDAGARAVKIEEWRGQFGNVDLKTDIAVIEAARDVLGDERELMIDVQNRWRDVGQALQTIRAIEQFRPYFIEAPLPADNIEGYARLAASTGVRIAVGDWGFAGRHEFADLLRRGRVDVVQPSSVRAGGIHEMLNIAEDAYRHGALCIPHAWCHMAGVAAEVQMAAISPATPFIEFPMAFPHSDAITDLLTPRLELEPDGTIAVPDRPGLGFELNEDVVERFRVDPY